MTDLRQAAQQALEALEGWEHCDKWVWPATALEQAKRNTTESLAALRTALEQQQAKPVAQSDLVKRLRETASKGVSVWGNLQMEAAREIEILRAERDCYASAMDKMLAASRAEPIGWLDGNDKLAEFMHRDLKAEHDKRGSATPRDFTIPVYTAPPQQQAEPVNNRIYECAKRLVEYADFKLGGILSADSSAKDIPSNAVSHVKSRHLAALRNSLYTTAPQHPSIKEGT